MTFFKPPKTLQLIISGMNYPAASGRSINPKKQKQDTPQAAGELTQKRLKSSKNTFDCQVKFVNRVNRRSIHQDALFSYNRQIQFVDAFLYLF